MTLTETHKNRHCVRCLFLLVLLISLLACTAAKPTIQGKWEATFVSRRSAEGAKVIYEFLPDGTFNATPVGSTTIVDKDKYEILDEGRTVKMRSALFEGDAVCKLVDDALKCETVNGQINLKKL